MIKGKKYKISLINNKAEVVEKMIATFKGVTNNKYHFISDADDNEYGIEREFLLANNQFLDIDVVD